MGAKIRETNAFARGRVISQMGDRACRPWSNDDTRLVRAFVPHLRGIILNSYDEYLSSCVSLLGNFKSQWGDLRLNLNSQRGPQGVCIGPGASDVPELVVLCPYK